MAKYSKPRGGQLTLSSTTLVWGISLFLVILVGGIGGGMYLGYRWGYDAGFQRGSAQAQQQPKSSQPVERWSLTPDTAARNDTPNQGTRTGAYTDEDIQFLDEDTAGPAESGESGQAPETDRSSGEGTPAPEGSGGETPALRTGESSVNARTGEQGGSGGEAVGQTFTIQTVSTRHEDRARKVVQQLREMGHKVRLTEATVDGTLYYRVRVGSFSSREEAQTYAEEMVDEGEIDDYWISKVRL